MLGLCCWVKVVKLSKTGKYSVRYIQTSLVFLIPSPLPSKIEENCISTDSEVKEGVSESTSSPMHQVQYLKLRLWCWIKNMRGSYMFLTNPMWLRAVVMNGKYLPYIYLQSVLFFCSESHAMKVALTDRSWNLSAFCNRIIRRFRCMFHRVAQGSLSDLSALCIMR